MRSHILCCVHVHPSLRTRSSRRARQAGQTSRVPSTRSSEQIPMACVAQGSRKLQASRSAFSASGCGRVLYTHARFSPPADENEASAATAMRPAMSARTRAATIRAMPLDPSDRCRPQVGRCWVCGWCALSSRTCKIRHMASGRFAMSAARSLVLRRRPTADGRRLSAGRACVSAALVLGPQPRCPPLLTRAAWQADEMPRHGYRAGSRASRAATRAAAEP